METEWTQSGSVCVIKTGFLSTQQNSQTSKHWMAIGVTNGMTNGHTESEEIE